MVQFCDYGWSRVGTIHRMIYFEESRKPKANIKIYLIPESLSINTKIDDWLNKELLKLDSKR